MKTDAVFRVFKRHFHKTLSARDGLSGALRTKVTFEEGALSVESSLPDEPGAIRFIVLMRRFLNTRDEIHYRKLWDKLKSEFGLVIGDEQVSSVDEAIRTIQAGHFSIEIDGKKYTPEKIYQTILEGHFIGQDEEVRRNLEIIVARPPAGHLLWQEFYGYVLDVFNLVRYLFSLVRLVEESPQYKAQYPARAVDSPRCIYCLSSLGPFTSEEHVIPESFGNDELVLQRGMVCDSCNSGVLSQLDEALAKSPVLAFSRVLNVSFTKKGKLPKASFQNCDVERIGLASVRIKQKDKTVEPKNKQELGDGWISFQTEFRGQWDAREFARSLYKIGLGMVAFEQGVEAATHEKYDAARSFIARGEGFDNNLLMRMECEPHNMINVSYDEWSEGTPFIMDVYGIIFIYNLEPEPKVRLDDHLENLKFRLFSLERKPAGAK